MSPLAEALTAAMTASRHDLVVFDKEASSWQRRPWPEVHGAAEAVAAWLLARDDHGAVGLFGEPTADFVAALQGTWLAGASVSILPGPVRGADGAQWAEATLTRLTALGVRTVLGHGAQLELLSAAAHPDVHVEHLANAVRHSAALRIPAPTGAPAVLQGTAGSTGSPRTAVLSPAAVLANVRGLAERAAVDPAHDVGCTWLPLYHDMGLTFLLAGALTGSPLWLAPTSAFTASPFRWLHWLSESGASFTVGPNFAYNLLGKYARRVSGVDLGRVRFAINGGEPVDCDGFVRFAEAMSAFGFDAGAAAASYGLAEATCAVTTPLPGDGLSVDDVTGAAGEPQRHAMLGEPIPGMEIRIAGGGSEAGPRGREAGEIEIRGTSMMDGYHGDAGLGPDEWFPTGDIGYLVDGRLVVCGRAKELIHIAGRNVFPAEVEQAAARVRGVREGAVVAVGVGEDTLRPGLVVAAEFRGPDESGARADVMKSVASVCGVVPSAVVLMNPGTLPRTSSGKLRRLEVRKTLQEEGAL